MNCKCSWVTPFVNCSKKSPDFLWNHGHNQRAFVAHPFEANEEYRNLIMFVSRANIKQICWHKRRRNQHLQHKPHMRRDVKWQVKSGRLKRWQMNVVGNGQWECHCWLAAWSCANVGCRSMLFVCVLLFLRWRGCQIHHQSCKIHENKVPGEPDTARQMLPTWSQGSKVFPNHACHAKRRCAAHKVPGLLCRMHMMRNESVAESGRRLVQQGNTHVRTLLASAAAVRRQFGHPPMRPTLCTDRVRLFFIECVVVVSGMFPVFL